MKTQIKKMLNGFLMAIGFFGGAILLVKAASLTATSGTPLSATNWNDMIKGFFWGSGTTGIYYNGNVGIGTNTPGSKLEVNGDIKLNGITKLGTYSTKPTCDSNTAGGLIYDSNIKKPYICDGTNWKPLDSDFDSDGIADWADANDSNANILATNLIASNIKKGVKILSITGTLEEKLTTYSDCWYESQNINAVPTTYYTGSYIVLSAHMAGQSALRDAQDFGCYTLTNPNSRLIKVCMDMNKFGNFGSCDSTGNQVYVHFYRKDGKVTDTAVATPRYYWSCSTSNNDIRDWGAAVYCK